MNYGPANHDLKGMHIFLNFMSEGSHKSHSDGQRAGTYPYIQQQVWNRTVVKIMKSHDVAHLL